MIVLISYLFKSSVASGIFYLYYCVALRNKSFHSYNRFYLLSAIIISLITPFIHCAWFYTEAVQNIPLANLANKISSITESHSDNFFDTVFFICCIYILINIALFVLLAARITWIYSIKKKNKNIKMQGFTLIETAVKQAPFSFLSNLFWKQGLSAADTNGEKIFKHELTHIRQKHTYDKLFTQLVCCIFWINPFYWLIQKELNTIHEFIADESCIKHGDTASLSIMLLYSYSEGSYLSPSHSFFNSSLNRRLLMVGSPNKIRYAYLRKILALPVLLFVLAVLSVSAITKKHSGINIQTVNEAQKPAENIIPKPDTTRKENLEPITVTGYKLKKIPPQKTNIIPAKQRMKPITVTGHN
ncbi:M56 family metallopeptidase [Parafilimonas sp.]|uniref:M56 family metallopeptidase n=1 Tax=Parafilimonas sp. TaxID=1969739 RepID=UPI0039E543A1